jgi:hypothetical protein
MTAAMLRLLLAEATEAFRQFWQGYLKAPNSC